MCAWAGNGGRAHPLLSPLALPAPRSPRHRHHTLAGPAAATPMPHHPATGPQRRAASPATAPDAAGPPTDHRHPAIWLSYLYICISGKYTSHAHASAAHAAVADRRRQSAGARCRQGVGTRVRVPRPRPAPPAPGPPHHQPSLTLPHSLAAPAGHPFPRPAAAAPCPASGGRCVFA